jgi:hypothetical protein
MNVLEIVSIGVDSGRVSSVELGLNSIESKVNEGMVNSSESVQESVFSTLESKCSEGVGNISAEDEVWKADEMSISESKEDVGKWLVEETALVLH